MGVDVLETLHDLKQDALDAGVVQDFVVPRLHQLVEIPLHILHADVQLLAEGVQEDVEGWDEVGVGGQSPEEYHFSQLQAWGEGFKCLLHRLDGNLHGDLSVANITDNINSKATHHCAAAGNAGASASHPCQHNAAEASISNLLQNFEPVLEGHRVD